MDHPNARIPYLTSCKQRFFILVENDSNTKSHLIKSGKEILEKTNQFRLKKQEIIREVKSKYALLLFHEKYWLKRIRLRIRCEMEIRRRMEEWSSLKNLHAADREVM